NNRAPSVGGGVQNLGHATIENSSFFSNTASVDGSIRNKQALTLANSTIAGAAGGVGLNNNGTLYMRNSLIAISTGSADGASSDTIAVNTNHLVADGSSSASLSRDPLLGDLGDYGADTEAIPLLPGSPAIDAGDAATCLATDQRGIGRVGTCDIGAFESRGFSLTQGTGDDQSTPWAMAFSAPLTLTVTSSYTEPVDGGQITYVGPLSGAGINPVTSTVTITGGAGAFTPPANSTLGSYNVTAGATGATPDITYALTNTQRAPATTLTSSPNLSIFGQSVTFTASVTDSLGTPSGAVTFT